VCFVDLVVVVNGDIPGIRRWTPIIRSSFDFLPVVHFTLWRYAATLMATHASRILELYLLNVGYLEDDIIVDIVSSLCDIDETTYMTILSAGDPPVTGSCNVSHNSLWFTIEHILPSNCVQSFSVYLRLKKTDASRLQAVIPSKSCRASNIQYPNV
jgi:hypothetical protein